MAERSRAILDRIDADGGGAKLPDVLTSSDVIPFMGRSDFGDLLRFGLLPGWKPSNGKLWRCDRDVFIQWLRVYAYADGEANKELAADEPKPRPEQ